MGSSLRLLLLSSVAVFVMLASVGCGPSKHVQQRRESAYQQTLRSYSEALPPGTTREAVEEYLQHKTATRVATKSSLGAGRNDSWIIIGPRVDHAGP